MKNTLASLLVLFALASFADPLVDVFQDMETSSEGVTVTPSIAAASARTTQGGTWSVQNGSVQIRTAGERPLHGPITVRGGATYTDRGSTRGWGYFNNSGYDSVQYSFPADKGVVVFSGYITCNEDRLHTWDQYDVVNSGIGSTWAVLQVWTDGTLGTIALRAHSTIGTQSTFGEPVYITQGQTYWYSMRVNATGAVVDIAIYDISTWAEIGRSQARMIAGTIGIVNFGRADAHTVWSGTTSYLDDICISWNDVTWPFVPSTSISHGRRRK